MPPSAKSSRRPVVPHSLLSVASHELRGPAGVARGYLKLLQRDTALSDASQQAARGASSAIERIVSLLDEMTDYARLVAGELRLERTDASWQDLLDKAVARATLPAAPEIVWRPSAGLASMHVVVERRRIESALATLIEAVGRAQVRDATLTATVGRQPGSIAPVADLFLESGGEVSWCAPDITRGGLGFSLVLADAVITAHGWRLTERWQDGHWTGYRIAGLTRTEQA